MKSPALPQARYWVASVAVFLALPSLAGAQESVPEFNDVTSTHPAYSAVMYLRGQGMVKGYDDGTFRPDAQVDRAAAVKMILAGKVSDADAQASAGSVPPYEDIPGDAWYRGYVAAAAALGIIDAPPKTATFNGSRPVVLAEFLKLLLLAQGMDVSAFGEIQEALAPDVPGDAWFQKYFRLALASSVLMSDTDGYLHPEGTLSRGDVATLVYRLLMYKENRRTQALLTVAETKIASIVQNLTENDLASAHFSSVQALLAARGAHMSRPDTPIVQGALKIAESFRKIVQAYEAGVSGDFDRAIALTGECWNLAEQAKAASQDLTAVADQVQQIAHDLAEEARTMKGGAQ